MKLQSLLWAGCFAAAGLAHAATQVPNNQPQPPHSPLPGSPVATAAKPLPELAGVVSWKVLAKVESVKDKNRFVPKFSDEITGLNQQSIKLQGYMLPLDVGEKQKRFLLTSMPPSCAFCLPGGPDAVVEILPKTPVKYGFEPLVMSGRFSVLQDDAMGLYYRLSDAVVVSGR